MSDIIGVINRPKIEVCLDSIRTPNPLVETGGPTSLSLGAVADGQWLARSGVQIVGQDAPASTLTLTVSSTAHDGDPNASGVPAAFGAAPTGSFYVQDNPRILWRKASTGVWVLVGPVAAHDVFSTSIAPGGDDNAPGTAASPIASLKELSARCLALGSLQHHIAMAAGDYRLHDWKGEGYSGFTADTPVTSIGGVIRPAQIIGANSLLGSFTVASTSGLTITAQGTPGWAPGQFAGSVLELSYFGFTYYAPVLTNAAGAVTVNFGWNTFTGAFFAPPAPGSVVNIREAASRILPPLTNPSWAINRLHFHGRALFRFVDFDGVGGGAGGPFAREVGEYTFDACRFRNFSQSGLLGEGKGFLSGCYFDACGDVCVEQSTGSVQLNNSHVKGTQTGYRGRIQVGAGSVVTAEDLTEELYNAKTVDHVINDEAVAYRLDNVRDLMLVSRGGRYQKVNQAMRAAEGMGAVTRYLVNLDGGQNRVDLLDTANATVSAGTAYIRLAALAQNLSKADYASYGYRIDDSAGNWVFDGGSF